MLRAKSIGIRYHVREWSLCIHYLPVASITSQMVIYRETKCEKEKERRGGREREKERERNRHSEIDNTIDRQTERKK